jgi:hypothetical protein
MQMTKHLEGQDGAASAHSSSDHIDALRAQAFDPKEHAKVLGKALTFAGIGMAEVGAGVGAKVLEFGSPFDKADPFKQSGFDDSKGTLDKLWHGVKKIFGSEDKLDDQIKKYVEEKKLSPEEKNQLEKEKKLYDEEMEKHRASYLQMNIAGKIYPMPDVEHDPRFKEMKHVKDLVKQEESDIKKSVEGKMPGLMPQVKKEMDEYDDSYKIHNPLGTGEGFRPHVAGKYLEVYWEEVRKETERRAEK